jgi:F-type H+-transporting ATPase subunit b
MSNLFVLGVSGTELANLAKSTGEQFGFHWPIFWAQVGSFVIVALLLKKFAYGPIVKVLEERRNTIEQGLANAEKIKAELASTEAARKQVLEQANAQANKLIEEARAAAARVQEQETQKAIATAEQIIAKAREAAAADHARMMADLRKEVGRLVVETTAKVTGKVLTMDDQKKLAEETSKQLAA